MIQEKATWPDPIPVVVLGRLAVHADRAGKGIGRGLLKDAVLRTAGVAKEIGIRALVCHAISSDDPADANCLTSSGF